MISNIERHKRIRQLKADLDTERLGVTALFVVAVLGMCIATQTEYQPSWIPLAAAGLAFVGLTYYVIRHDNLTSKLDKLSLKKPPNERQDD